MSTPYFKQRVWSISLFGNWEQYESTLDRALQEAPRHNITGIELMDYVASWVDTPARYARWPRLAQAKELTCMRGQRLTPEARLAQARRLKAMAEKIRRAGYEFTIWYHTFRDLPKETFDLHPELKDADGDALYQFLGDSLRDAFDFFPEINYLTVTSLHETPSILRVSGKSSPADRLTRLYRTLYDACKAKGVRLVLRDFISRKDEFDLFEEVLDRLPDDIILQTKDVVADWGAHEKPVNPYIVRYSRRKNPLQVEFELSNNFAGEMETPWCDPEYLWRRMRLMADLGCIGAVGRLVNTDVVSVGNIFNTPNEIMAWAFAKFLVDPGRLLRKPDDEWDRTYDQFDMSPWRDWANLRFGEKAAPEVIQILQQTPRLTNLIYNTCGAFPLWGRFTSAYTPENVARFKKARVHPYHAIPATIRAVRRCGGDLARAEKAEAMRIVEESLQRLEAIKDDMLPEGFANVHGAFLRARHVASIFQTITDAFVTAIEVADGRASREMLAEATDSVRDAGRACSQAYGDLFLEGLPKAALANADFLDEMADHVSEYEAIGA